MLIKIGTRKSKLALWQANHIAGQLEKSGVQTELVTMDTRGDKVLDVSIAKIGSKGVFTEELEEKLGNGEIDIAVHSAKDMQSSLPDGFEIIAFSEREEVNDVLVSDEEVQLSDSSLTVGTSSTRRVALLKHYYPHVNIVDMRGNLQTRIQKMRDGVCDALLLAYAGVHRMGYDALIRQKLSTLEFTPPVGQGSMAIEAHSGLNPEKKAHVRRVVNHEPTERTLLAERSFLKTMDGGCSIPVFGLATLSGGTIVMDGGIIDIDGSSIIRKHESHEDPVKVGETMATLVLEAGGERILRSIKDSL